MSHPEHNSTPDRVKLPFTFDPERLLAEVQAMSLRDFVHYDVVPLRSPAHFVDPTVPAPPPAADFADGSWTQWKDAPGLERSPHLQEVLAAFNANTAVNLVRVLRLEAGGVIAEHTDPTLGLHIERSMVRLTVPIVRGPACTFWLNDIPVPMLPGECWYLRLTDPHKVHNNGTAERMSLTIDVVPNPWLQELIQSAAL
ncbi:MAG: mannose-6-phosphate isomerase-like protein (cupin superfamily) [Bradymonadia bacterium]|jgi:mannose-6-phosphate isomerase-like protein (cupin superfamily)